MSKTTPIPSVTINKETPVNDTITPPDLILVDVQHGFITGGSSDSACRDALNHILDILNSDTFHHVFATQFITDGSTPATGMFHRHLGYHDMDRDLTEDGRTTRTNPATDLIDAIDEVAEYLFVKDTYGLPTSIVESIADTRAAAGVITPVTVMGFDTDACVLAVCFQLWDAGIEFTVNLNGCASSTGRHAHTSAAQIMRTVFGGDSIIESPIDVDRDTWITANLDQDRIDADIRRITDMPVETYTDPYPDKKGDETVNRPCGHCGGTGCVNCNNTGWKTRTVQSVRNQLRVKVRRSQKRHNASVINARQTATDIERTRLGDIYDKRTEHLQDSRLRDAGYTVGARLRNIPVTVLRTWSQNGPFGKNHNVVFSDHATGAEIHWITKHEIANALTVGRELAISGTIVSINKMSLRINRVWCRL